MSNTKDPLQSQPNLYPSSENFRGAQNKDLVTDAKQSNQSNHSQKEEEFEKSP